MSDFTAASGCSCGVIVQFVPVSVGTNLAGCTPSGHMKTPNRLGSGVPSAQAVP
jgi:hypothetical protein